VRFIWRLVFERFGALFCGEILKVLFQEEVCYRYGYSPKCVHVPAPDCRTPKVGTGPNVNLPTHDWLYFHHQIYPDLYMDWRLSFIGFPHRDMKRAKGVVEWVMSEADWYVEAIVRSSLVLGHWSN
jgi:hypothetical protein